MKEMRKMQVWSLCRDDSLEEEMTIHSSILVWIFPWTRNLVGYSPWDCRIKQIEHRIMCSMQARTHTYMQTHTNACTHRDLPSPGPREEAAGWEHLDFVHIWKRHICLSWNMSLRSKCLIWQASGRVPNCSVMETGGRHLFFSFFFFLVGAIFKLSLCLTTAYCISQTEAYTPMWVWIFATATTQGTPLDHLALKISRTWTCVLIAAI